MEVGEAIRVVRTRAKVRQGDLARRAGVSQSLVSMVENGRRNPTMEMVERLCKAMNVPAQLVLLLACEPKAAKRRYLPALDRLRLAMLDLLAAVR